METSDSKFNININFQIESYLEYQADKQNRLTLIHILE